MLWHIVKFRMRPDVDEVRREHFLAMLRDLGGTIDTLRFVRAAPSIDEPDVIGLLTGFDDVEGLEAYKVHPAHLLVIAASRELLAEIVRLDIETPDLSDALPLSLSR